MARPVSAEPTSRAAVWGLRLTLVGIAVMVVAILAARADRLDGHQTMVAIVMSLAIIGAGVGLAMVGGAVIWVTGHQGARKAALAVILGLAIAAYPVALGILGLMQPALADVSTDPIDPPAFVVAAMARPASANPVAYPAGNGPLQRRLHPEIRPIDVDLPAETVNEIVNDFVEQRRWTVLDQVDYRGAEREGRVELVTRSLILGLRDDIVLRIRHVNGRTRIDMRSAARYGRQDFGVNARRTISALDDLRAAARRALRER